MVAGGMVCGAVEGAVPVLPVPVPVLPGPVFGAAVLGVFLLPATTSAMTRMRTKAPIAVQNHHCFVIGRFPGAHPMVAAVALVEAEVQVPPASGWLAVALAESGPSVASVVFVLSVMSKTESAERMLAEEAEQEAGG